MNIRKYTVYSLNELISLIFLILTTWIILLIALHRIDSSKFSHYENNYKTYLSKSDRLLNSSLKAKNDLKYWLKKNLALTPLFSQNKTNYLCLSVLSKNRIGSTKNYVTQSVMSILTRASLKYRNKIRIFGFNMEPEPEKNQNLLDLNDLIQVENLSSKFEHKNMRLVEALDYAKCLRYLRKQACKYSILIEDDAVFSTNWYEKIENELRKIEKLNLKNFFIIKLFSGYKFFDNDWIFYPFLLIWALFLSVVVWFLEFLFLTRIRKLKLSNFSVICLFLNSLVLVWFSRTTSISPMGEGVHEYTTGFGAVSVLFPWNRLLSLAEYMENTVESYLSGKSIYFEAKDLLIEDFRSRNRLVEYILEPSIIQHTGMHSSLYKRDMSQRGFRLMYKSFSFVDNFKLIEFNESSFRN